MDIFQREKLLIGEEKFNYIKDKKIIVFGCGGVGSYVIEALARAGIENIDIVDKDIIDETNINLVDNTFIKDKLEETNYEIFHIDMQYQAKGAKVDFYDYKTEYINITTGENNSLEYKNVIRSVLKKNVSKASVEEICKYIQEHNIRQYQIDVIGITLEPILRIDHLKNI